jgi:hypothetical protein
MSPGPGQYPAPPSYLERPQVKAKLLALLGASTLSASDAARAISTVRYRVTENSVRAFQKRHEAELIRIKEQKQETFTDLAITDKHWRLEQLQNLWDLMWAEILQNGITFQEEGRSVLARSRNYRGDLVRQARTILRDSADEMGQVPKRSAFEVNRRPVNNAFVEVSKRIADDLDVLRKAAEQGLPPPTLPAVKPGAYQTSSGPGGSWA